MAVLLANNARSTLAGAIDDNDTTLTVQSGDAAKFPNPTGGDWFPVTVVKADGSLEIMRCTGRATAVLTVVRAQEGTSALSFDVGASIGLRLTNGVLTLMQDLIDDKADASALAALATTVSEKADADDVAAALAEKADADDTATALDAKLAKASNLNDVANKATARSNLGLGSMATRNVTVSSAAPSGGVDGDIWLQVDP